MHCGVCTLILHWLAVFIGPYMYWKYNVYHQVVLKNNVLGVSQFGSKTSIVSVRSKCFSTIFGKCSMIVIFGIPNLCIVWQVSNATFAYKKLKEGRLVLYKGGNLKGNDYLSLIHVNRLRTSSYMFWKLKSRGKTSWFTLKWSTFFP